MTESEILRISKLPTIGFGYSLEITTHECNLIYVFLPQIANNDLRVKPCVDFS